MSFTKNFLGGLAELQTKKPLLIIVLALVITLAVLPGAGMMSFDTDNKNFLPEKDPVYLSLEEISYNFGGLSTLSFIYELDPNYVDESGLNHNVKDLRNYAFLEQVDKAEQMLLALDYVDRVQSPITRLKQLNEGKIPKNNDFLENQIASDPDLANAFNNDYSRMRVTLLSGQFGKNEAEQEKNFDEMLSIMDLFRPPEGIKARAFGSITQFMELQNNMNSDQRFTTLLGFLFVFIVVLIFYRNVLSGFLALIPVLLASLWALGLMGYISLPFTVMTSSMFALVIGMGIDFSIHLMHHIKVHLGEGDSIEEAVKKTMLGSGVAIFSTSITTIAGFLSLTLATLLITQRVGVSLAIAVGAIFIACMLIVPAAMVLEHRLKNGEKIFWRNVK